MGRTGTSSAAQPHVFVPGTDASRHERPRGEPGSYPLTNLAPAPPSSSKL